MKGDTFADDGDVVRGQIAFWKTIVKNYSTTKSKRWGDTGLSAF